MAYFVEASESGIYEPSERHENIAVNLDQCNWLYRDLSDGSKSPSIRLVGNFQGPGPSTCIWAYSSEEARDADYWRLISLRVERQP